MISAASNHELNLPKSRGLNHFGNNEKLIRLCLHCFIDTTDFHYFRCCASYLFEHGRWPIKLKNLIINCLINFSLNFSSTFKEDSW